MPSMDMVMPPLTNDMDITPAVTSATALSPPSAPPATDQHQVKTPGDPSQPTTAVTNDAEPDPKGNTQGGQVLPNDIDMAGPDDQDAGPNNVFSTFWASVTTGHSSLAAVYDITPNVFFGIDWQFFVEMMVAIPPSTEAHLAQALEHNPTVVTAKLVCLMLSLGMHFHVLWSPAWGASWAQHHQNRDDPLPLPTYLANAPAPLGPLTMPFHELNVAYLLRAHELFNCPCNARLLCYGGIIWRLILHHGGVDPAEAVLDGPLSSYAFNAWFFTTPDGSHCDNPVAWQDDPVIREAIGTSPYLSAPMLWPDPDVWEHSSRWSGCWNVFAETWFTSCIAEIEDHTARPLTPCKWRENLRGINQGICDNTRVHLQLTALLPGLHANAATYLADSPLSQQGRLQLLAASAPP
ncbi:hypothetical protein EWM64_g9694 [Hericium alpestre]|uniref:Uncharacterized protein n=1 Tax=Hericium alpestre TaxID=135208 RepID=A0A4Y9ZJV5_9AGAM|nr:hypothetical protein EWM64_g9694 [Hericium alpestre]